MKVRLLLLSVLAMGSLWAQAQKTPVWCDPNVNEINRKTDVANYFAMRVRRWLSCHKRL